MSIESIGTNSRMKILVTGGAGYIGSHLVKLLLETTEHEVTVIDSMIGGSFDPIPILEAMAPERMHFYRIDLSDTDEIERYSEKRISMQSSTSPHTCRWENRSKDR